MLDGHSLGSWDICFVLFLVSSCVKTDDNDDGKWRLMVTTVTNPISPINAPITATHSLISSCLFAKISGKYNFICWLVMSCPSKKRQMVYHFSNSFANTLLCPPFVHFSGCQAKTSPPTMYLPFISVNQWRRI